MENKCNALKFDNIISTRAEYESMLTLIASYGGIKNRETRKSVLDILSGAALVFC